MAIDDIRLAPNQNPPPGNTRFYAQIEKMTGIRREARPGGGHGLRLKNSKSLGVHWELLSLNDNSSVSRIDRRVEMLTPLCDPVLAN